MRSHLNEGGRTVSVAVAGHALEVGMELEVLHGVLVVALHEADRGEPLTHHAENSQGDLVLVRAHHLDSPAARLEHGGIVDSHPVGVGHRRLLVRIDGAHVQARVAPSEHFHHLPRPPPRLVLRLVEVGELDVLVEAVDHRLGLL